MFIFLLNSQQSTFKPITCVFTGRNEVVAKEMFLQVCVCPQGWEGVCLSACWDATPPGTRQTPPGPGRHPWDQAGTPPDQAGTPLQQADSSIRSTSGRYASYWNAFLLKLCFQTCISVMDPGFSEVRQLSNWDYFHWRI